jgi:hypothetical protein
LLKAQGAKVAAAVHDVSVSPEALGELEAQSTIAARVGVVDGRSARVVREHCERLKASITNLDKRVFLF